MEIDYRPTVHGVGLWIIEAKRPDEDLFSELHLGQAWSYATHPRVDVPFMVLANGIRLGVFDLGEDEWDKPILDIQQGSSRTDSLNSQPFSAPRRSNRNRGLQPPRQKRWARRLPVLCLTYDGSWLGFRA